MTPKTLNACLSRKTVLVSLTAPAAHSKPIAIGRIPHVKILRLLKRPSGGIFKTICVGLKLIRILFAEKVNLT